MWIALIIAGGVVVLLALLTLLPRVVLASIRGPLAARVRARYPDETRLIASDFTANSFGLESKGVLQARGNGALVLSPTELCFFQYMPEREIEIPLDRIVDVSFTRSHLGKATPFRLVKVQFEGPTGPDSIAVMVRRPDELRAQIDRARAGEPQG